MRERSLKHFRELRELSGKGKIRLEPEDPENSGRTPSFEAEADLLDKLPQPEEAGGDTKESTHGPSLATADTTSTYGGGYEPYPYSSILHGGSGPPYMTPPPFTSPKSNHAGSATQPKPELGDNPFQGTAPGAEKSYVQQPARPTSSLPAYQSDPALFSAQSYATLNDRSQLIFRYTRTGPPKAYVEADEDVDEDKAFQSMWDECIDNSIWEDEVAGDPKIEGIMSTAKAALLGGPDSLGEKTSPSPQEMGPETGVRPSGPFPSSSTHRELPPSEAVPGERGPHC